VDDALLVVAKNATIDIQNLDCDPLVLLDYPKMFGFAFFTAASR